MVSTFIVKPKFLKIKFFSFMENFNLPSHSQKPSLYLKQDFKWYEGVLICGFYVTIGSMPVIQKTNVIRREKRKRKKKNKMLHTCATPRSVHVFNNIL